MRTRFAALGLGLLVAAGCGHWQPTEGDVLNMEARIPTRMPVPALDWRVLSSGADRVHGTMSLLTGNEIAVRAAGTDDYPPGSELAMVTWLSREDPHWFGGRIAGTFVRLETVTVNRGLDGRPAAEYKRYSGTPLREETSPDASVRKQVILGIRPSLMP